MKSGMQVEIWRVARIGLDDRAAMERLYRAYYEGAPEETFQHDLSEKDLAIVLRDAEGVRGFSTLKCLNVEDVRVVFSGDTVVDAACRNQTGLAGAFGHVMARLAAADDPRTPYWFLICKGARTYRFLPTFFTRYVPGAQTDEELTGLLHRIAARLYPHAFNPRTGVLHFGAGKDRLKDDVLRMDAESRRFRALNPGWRTGDELACLAPLAMENLNRLGRRVIADVSPVWML